MGHGRSRIRGIWHGMLQRCGEGGDKNYYGRGIRVCEEWANDFEEFYRWSISHDYKDGLSIDRIDNDNGYEPGNCRWATDYEQQANRRVNPSKIDERYYCEYEVNGVKDSLRNLCLRYDVRPRYALMKMDEGYSAEAALRLPHGLCYTPEEAERFFYRLNRGEVIYMEDFNEVWEVEQ